MLLVTILYTPDAVSTLQESIIHLIEQKHDNERNAFMNIVHKISSFEVREILSPIVQYTVFHR